MWRSLIWLSIAGSLAAAWPTHAGTGRVLKVLPEFLDLKGHASLSPSLYERDAYQAQLRTHPDQRSGIRFFIQWKTKGGIWEPLKIKLELRGAAAGNLPRQLVFDLPVENTGGWFSHWTDVTLSGEEYRQFGGVTAWRATLWEGNHLLGAEQSFLW
jgi:hypothetical protein